MKANGGNGGLLSQPAPGSASRRGSKVDVDKDSLVRRVVELLDEEMEEEVKEVLKPYMGELAKVSCTHGPSRVGFQLTLIGRHSDGASVSGLYAS